MGKHKKDWNNTPFDPYVEPDQKAKEFDQQYESNRDAHQPDWRDAQQYPEGSK